jgi:hypothetical protein
MQQDLLDHSGSIITGARERHLALVTRREAVRLALRSKCITDSAANFSRVAHMLSTGLPVFISYIYRMW